jgi:membrane protein
MFSVLKQTVGEFLEDCCMRMAAALAYYTVFSLPPLAVILVMTLGLSYQAVGQGGQEAARKDLQKQVSLYVSDTAAEEISTIIQNAGITGGWLQWLLGIGGVLVGATGLVGALQDTLNEAWEVKPDPKQGGIKNFLMKRVFSLGIILAIGFILLVSMLLTTWVGKIVGAGGDLAATAVSFHVITLLFAAMFNYLPDAEVEWRDAFLGAALTSILFSLGKYGLSSYLSHSKFESQFGAAAAFAILLAWVYYSSLILLFGAEFTQVWAKHQGRVIRPEPGAVRVVQETKHVRENEPVAS